jgi:hypothetical protein
MTGHIVSHELPCPRCGYDLRGTVVERGGRRCPECGGVWRGGELSRVPWVHRGRLGRVRGYVRTVKVVMFRPGVLAREAPLGEREARQFHRVSLVVAAVVATALLLGTFFLRGLQWENDLAAHIPTAEDRRNVPIEDFPMYALTDSVWIVVPLGICVYLGLGAAMWLYRVFLRVGSGDRRHARRVRRVGLYASGLLPVTLALLGLLAMGGMVIYEEHSWLTDELEMAWQAGLFVLGAAAAAFFYVPTLRLVWLTGRWKGFRIVLMLPIFPYAAGLAGLGITVVVFWGIGYVAIAFWSMFH